jgi:hypothetical protein
MNIPFLGVLIRLYSTIAQNRSTLVVRNFMRDSGRAEASARVFCRYKLAPPEAQTLRFFSRTVRNNGFRAVKSHQIHAVK